MVNSLDGTSDLSVAAYCVIMATLHRDLLSTFELDPLPPEEQITN